MKKSIRLVSAALAPTLVAASLMACGSADEPNAETESDTETAVVTQAATQKETEPATEPVTDPVTGLTFGYLRYTDTKSNKVYITLEALYGFKVVRPAGLQRIVSA